MKDSTECIIYIIICVVVCIAGVNSFWYRIEGDEKRLNSFITELQDKGLQVVSGTKNSDGTVFTVYTETKTDFLDLAKNTGIVYRWGYSFYVFSEDYKIAYAWRIT